MQLKKIKPPLIFILLMVWHVAPPRACAVESTPHVENASEADSVDEPTVEVIPEIVPDAPPEESAATEQPEEMLVSLDFKEAEIADVLSALAKAYSLNIVAGREISGKVSINLENVTLEDALDSVLALNKYGYVREKNIITVVSQDTQTKTEILRFDFANANEVKDLFKDVLSDYGDLRVNERLNEIILTDTVTALKKAHDLLYQVDVPPLQVIIEAKLVDIDPEDLSNLGLDLDLQYMFNHKNRDYDFNFDYNLGGPSGSLSGNDLLLGFEVPLFPSGNAVTLDSLLQKTKANLLSAPRIAVLNNQQAKIVIGEKVGIREQTQTASGTIESVRFVDVGITLNVTPQINRRGYVTMEVTTEVSSVSSFVDNLPRITTREATTNVRVRDGETVVIAGLLKDEYSDTTSSLPFIESIPLIGKLAGNFASSRSLKELVIFLTPRILYAGDRINPEDDEAVMRRKMEIEGVRAKHEQLMNAFRKDGLDDALDMDPLPKQGQEAFYYERAEWFEKTASRDYRSSKHADTRLRYLNEAAGSYYAFALARPDDPKATDALVKAAQLYAEKLDDPARAFEVLRTLVKDHPQSKEARSGLSQLKQLKHDIDKRVAKDALRRDKMLKKLSRVELSTAEELKGTSHAEIPLPSA